MRTLVIRDSEWLRGNGFGVLWTQPYDGSPTRYCCLGLDLRDRGVELTEVYSTPGRLRVAAPESCPREYAQDWVDESKVNPSDNADSNQAVDINDNSHTTDDEKIEALRPIFASKGIELDWRPNE